MTTVLGILRIKRWVLLTNKCDGFLEPGREIGILRVFNRNGQISELIRKVVIARSRDIYHSCHSQLFKKFHVASMAMVTEKDVR